MREAHHDENFQAEFQLNTDEKAFEGKYHLPHHEGTRDA